MRFKQIWPVIFSNPERMPPNKTFNGAGQKLAWRKCRTYKAALALRFPRSAFLATNDVGHSPSHACVGQFHGSICKSNRDDEKTVFKELVPTLACLNSSRAGLSAFWSSVVRYKRSL
jgi:hypothetical protein